MKKIRKLSVKNHPGVRYYEHDKRKYRGRSDRYFSIRYRINGKPKEEGIGWESQGRTAKEASEHLAELKKALRTGIGPQTLAQKRELRREQEERKKQEEIKKEAENISFNQVWNIYFPNAKTQKKECSWKREETLFRLWISPVIGEKPMAKIVELDIERIKRDMVEKRKSPATICYAIAVIRQIYNFAKRNNLIKCASPTQNIKKPKKDNRRERYLTPEEASELLISLKEKSETLYEMALLSLHTGLRSNEIRSLRFCDLNLRDKTIHIKDTKNHKNRIAYMTGFIYEIFEAKTSDNKSDFIFKDRKGKPFKEIPKLFRETVKSLGLNDTICDPRNKVVFHTLRHTYASWLVKKGYDLYYIRKLLGHSSITMTERYAHHAPKTLRSSVDFIEDIFRLLAIPCG